MTRVGLFGLRPPLSVFHTFLRILIAVVALALLYVFRCLLERIALLTAAAAASSTALSWHRPAVRWTLGFQVPLASGRVCSRHGCCGSEGCREVPPRGRVKQEKHNAQLEVERLIVAARKMPGSSPAGRLPRTITTDGFAVTRSTASLNVILWTRCSRSCATTADGP